MLNQPVRRVVRGTLTQWNRLFRGAGRHSDLVTVRRRSQGDAWGREEKLSAIGSQISSLFWLACYSLLCSHSYISLPAFSALVPLFPPPSASSYNFQSGRPALKEIHCPRSRQRLCCWNGIGLDKQEQNKILVTSLPHHGSGGLKPVINNNLFNTTKCFCCCCWWACYALACNGHGLMKGPNWLLI